MLVESQRQLTNLTTNLVSELLKERREHRNSRNNQTTYSTMMNGGAQNSFNDGHYTVSNGNHYTVCQSCCRPQQLSSDLPIQEKNRKMRLAEILQPGHRSPPNRLHSGTQHLTPIDK